MRRLPVYLLLDTSGSMRGEPIESVSVGLATMLSSLRQDPFALETVFVSILTFDREAALLMPLTPVDEFCLPEFRTPESGPTFLGKCLELLCQRVDLELQPSTQEFKGDWQPLLFIMTDGSPSDIQLFRQMIPEVKRRPFAKIVACAAGSKAKTAALSELTDEVVALDTTDSNSFSQFFQWVSSSVSAGSRSVGASTDSLHLPPPPPEVHVIL